MSRIDTLKNRLLSCPRDFTWHELKKFLLSIGYTEISLGKTSGLRVRCVNDDHPPIVLPKPHPKSIMKGYQLKQVVQHLSKEGLL
jgi:hypothetical protein